MPSSFSTLIAELLSAASLELYVPYLSRFLNGFTTTS